jgi:hypothetical protein
MGRVFANCDLVFWFVRCGKKKLHVLFLFLLLIRLFQGWKSGRRSERRKKNVSAWTGNCFPVGGCLFVSFFFFFCDDLQVFMSYAFPTIVGVAVEPEFGFETNSSWVAGGFSLIAAKQVFPKTKEIPYCVSTFKSRLLGWDMLWTCQALCQI